MAATMMAVLWMSLLMLPPCIWATSFNVVNNCGGTIDVQVVENVGGPSIGTSGFSLASKASKTLIPPNGWAGNIGTGTPGLLAEFSINIQAGVDHYDISAVNGFFLNVGMSITGNGQGLSCNAAASICPAENVNGNACVSPNRDSPTSTYAQNVQAGCPDVFSWSGDNTKDHGTATGGTFTITFCP